jgi:hypothetical protein
MTMTNNAIRRQTPAVFALVGASIGPMRDDL